LYPQTQAVQYREGNAYSFLHYGWRK